MKKIFNRKFLIILFILLLTSIFLYFKNYKDTIDNFSALIDERCDNLQPILDKKMDFAANYYNSYIASESAEIQTQYLIGYLDQVDQTIKFSEPWLEKAKSSVNTLTFQLFLDKRVKEKIYALLDKLNADYLSNVAVRNFYSNPSEDTANKLKQSIEYMDIEKKAMDEKTKAAESYWDFRGYFLNLRQPKCNLIKEDSPGVPLTNPSRTG